MSNDTMSAEEIVRGLLAECEDCSERDGRGGCDAIYYCANREAAALIKSQAAEIAEYQKFGEPDNVYKMLKYYAAEVKRLTAENGELVIKVVASQQETRVAVEEIEKLLAEDIAVCDACGNRQCYRKGGTGQYCEPIWRGPQEAGEEK